MRREYNLLPLMVFVMSLLGCEKSTEPATPSCPVAYESQIDMHRSHWHESSPPLNPATELEYDAPGCEFYWYNAARTWKQEYLMCHKRDLDPSLNERCDGVVPSLIISAIEPEQGQWCGAMTGFSGGLDISKAGYFEIWINDYQPEPTSRSGVVYVEFGLIDEDFHAPQLNRLDDEDKPPYGWTIYEDTGFEGDFCRFPYDFSDASWDPAKGVYIGINCRRGNGVHDSEDLNGNGYLDRENAYYHFEINLADSAVVDVQRDYPKDTYAEYWNAETVNQYKAWRLYRVSLANIEQALVSPSGLVPRMDAIQHFRIWLPSPASIEGQLGHQIETSMVRFHE
jgi:hypothetical protein